MESFSVHGAPSEYILIEGVLDQLEAKLLERSYHKVLIVHGINSWQAAKTFWPQFTQIKYEEFTYGGECSIAEIETLRKIVVENSYDGLLAVGGGKVLDLVKAVSHLTHKSFILIPTLASNCSPWTPLSVIYDESGAFIRYDIYPNSASLVVIEPRILVNAPINLLIAGIGDTLAKWYEADVQMAAIENKPIPLQISHYAARQCKEILLAHSEGAIHAAKTGTSNDDFVKVAETIIVLAGMVGGFGDQYGRIAGAHAIHNGLTILEETHHALHGEKVAYGILVQLVLEEKWEEIKSLIPFYQTLKLPVSLSQLGVKEITETIINALAQKSAIPEESIHVMPIGPITASRVSEAITTLEQRGGYYA
ncbi:glycerol dehydrogenase [Desulfitobacterium metallireducens DSM 15288]|uniref:Glycerol dehydrogenase n=1 Tax=Desulfitobacterium metallireducens DSM 15288 TaxID=871968 RepID=W0E8C8_9FIRM|nr:glycerol dehydrogenase [Desulfitobacterium metallireducens DSM 15288]